MYSSIARRYRLLEEISQSEIKQRLELAVCKNDICHWFNNWVWTYDPRNTTQKDDLGFRIPADIPMDLFPRQEELLLFLEQCLSNLEDGLIEKSRDIGFTWLAGGFAVHKWIFFPGFKSTFGSRSIDLVDKIGDPDSIFEKIRMMLRRLPGWMMPPGFAHTLHDNYKRIVNPANENVIRGEGGEEIGRGGRSSVLLLDEAAHLEHGDRVDAASSGNTDVRIWASSVNGMTNTFARKRFGGTLQPRQIFRYHYSSDPRKTPEWVVKKRSSLEAHVWASEYEIDYSASIEGLCIPDKWVQAALRIRALLLEKRGAEIHPNPSGIAGLDVGAGKAYSVCVARFGPVVVCPLGWKQPDTIETAYKALDYVDGLVITGENAEPCQVTTLAYDAPGVGSGVQAALNHHDKLRLITLPINTGVSPGETLWEDGLTSDQKFLNLKAEMWFLARERFKAVHELCLFLEGDDGGHDHPLTDIISLPAMEESSDAQILAAQISLPRWFRNEKGKVMMETKAQLASRSIPSPDHADALMLTFLPTDNIDVWDRL